MSKLRAALGSILAFAIGASAAVAGDTRTGEAAIGLLKFSDDAVAQVTRQLKDAKGDLEIAFLVDFDAAGFDADNFAGRFSQPRTIIQSVLPTLGADDTLTVTGYLWFYHKTGPYRNAVHPPYNVIKSPFRWGAFDQTDVNALDNDTDKAWRTSQWESRLHAFDQFVLDMRAWVTFQGAAIKGKLKFVVVPELEDTAADSNTGKARWANLRHVIARQQAADGIEKTALRRSCVDANIFRVGSTPLELHASADGGPPGRQLKALLDHGTLKNGDVFTLDGREVASADEMNDFIDQQKRAVRKGVSVLWWRGWMNSTSSPRRDDHTRLLPSLRPPILPQDRDEIRLMSRQLKAR